MKYPYILLSNFTATPDVSYRQNGSFNRLPDSKGHKHVITKPQTLTLTLQTGGLRFDLTEHFVTF